MTTKLADSIQFHRGDFLQDAQLLTPLQTNIEKQVLITSLDNKILTFGSCFAQNLQKIISRFGIDVYFERNTCAHYTTASLKQLLEIAAGKKALSDCVYHLDDTDTDVILFPFFRLRFYGDSAKTRVLEEAKRLISELIQEIKTRELFVVTLGTTVVFELEGRGVVAALNGMPLEDCKRNNFVSTSVIKDDLNEINQLLALIKGNAEYKIIYTVSPQRYNWREEDTGLGFYQFNTLSKSTLIVALNEFIQQSDPEKHIYFPSYEIVIEELRQYETLATYDYLHINTDTTPKYVVKRFLQTYASESMLQGFVILDNLRYLLDFTNARLNAGAKFNSDMIYPHWQSLLDAATRIENEETIGITEKIIEKMSTFSDKA